MYKKIDAFGESVKPVYENPSKYLKNFNEIKENFSFFYTGKNEGKKEMSVYSLFLFPSLKNAK